MYQELYFYINFDWEKYVDDNNYLLRIYEIIELAYQHKAIIFYSNQQIQEFVKNCNAFDSNFTQSHGNKLHLLLENALGKTTDCHLFEVCFSHKKTSLNHIIAVSTINLDKKHALISINEKSQHKNLLFVECQKSIPNFEKIQFFIVTDNNSLLNWLQNSVKRNFNVTDKHKEKGQGSWKDASELLCSKEQAQQLLNTAIPDFTEKENRLFNFDDEHQTFIEFFYEGNNPQKQWHGFHIKPEEWEKRIPDSVKKYFHKK